MSWLTRIAAAIAVVAFGGCGGGGGAPKIVTAFISPPTPAPGADRLGYALLSGSRSTPLDVTAYSSSGSSLYSKQPFGGGSIAFDASGLLWFDRIGDLTAYLPDGSDAVLPSTYGIGALATFDARGNLYTTGADTVSAYAIGSDRVPRLIRTLPTPLEPCWVAADASGRVYVATCLAGPSVFHPTLGPVSMYPPAANDPTVTNTTATGPVAVDGSGNVYAVYNGAVGVWNAGAFGATPPIRTLPAGPAGTIMSIAIDRAGTAYVIVRPTPTTFTTQSTLYTVAAGSSTPVILQTGFVDQVATPPK
ncbi:MAG: hypothetical protein JWO85_2483 [Candidatus Eremiobacteraeota bacterium]|jgi:hypothetical protein|nr:hypothetical protein [Candidatus Eremiobacteraeota bacterium]